MVRPINSIWLAHVDKHWSTAKIRWRVRSHWRSERKWVISGHSSKRWWREHGWWWQHGHLSRTLGLEGKTHNIAITNMYEHVYIYVYICIYVYLHPLLKLQQSTQALKWATFEGPWITKIRIPHRWPRWHGMGSLAPMGILSRSLEYLLLPGMDA